MRKKKYKIDRWFNYGWDQDFLTVVLAVEVEETERKERNEEDESAASSGQVCSAEERRNEEREANGWDAEAQQKDENDEEVGVFKHFSKLNMQNILICK